jgi:plastocyanin
LSNYTTLILYIHNQYYITYPSVIPKTPTMVSVRSLLTASALVAVASAANHTIVAQADLTFNPSEITADEGDWLIFQFQSGNHSAVSGPFTSPCEPATSGGFFSGHFPTDSGTNVS